MLKKRYIKKKIKQPIKFKGELYDFLERNQYTDIVDKMIEENQINDSNAKINISIDGEDIEIKIKWTEECEEEISEKIEIIAKRAFDNGPSKDYIIYIKSIYKDIDIRKISVTKEDLKEKYKETENTIFLKNAKEEGLFVKEQKINLYQKFKLEIEDIIKNISKEEIVDLLEKKEIKELLISESKTSIYKTNIVEKIKKTYKELKRS